MKKPVYLIDGSSFLYRAYYGLKPLHTTKGTPVQAILGFCRMIKKVIDDYAPERLVIFWDSRGKTFRSEIYSEYKATRQAAPSDLGFQKDQIIRFADLVGICQVSRVGYEADDLIASVIEEHPREDFVIIASDKDLYQLLDKRVILFDPFKKTTFTREKFINMRGFEPENLLLYHSLLGDSSDNIPGVRGIGKKGADILVKQFKTLDKLYENLDKVEKERIRDLLEDQKKEAYLSQKLFTLKYEKIGKKFEQFVFSKDDWPNAYKFFLEFELTSLLRGMKPPVSYVQTSIDPVTGEQIIPKAFEDPDTKRTVKKNWKCVIVNTEELLADLMADINKAKYIALDVETTGLLPLEDELVGLSFACDKKTGYYVPVAHKDDSIDQLSRDFVLEKLRPILEGDKVKKTLHNAKFDRLVLYQYGIKLGGVAFDSLLAANLVRKSWQEKIGLKSLSQLYLDEPMRPFSDVVGKNETFATVDLKPAAEYSAHDSIQTYKLKPIFEKKLNKVKKLKKLFYELELPMSDVLYRVEAQGIILKPEVLESLGVSVEKELKKIESKLFGGDRKRINLNSPKQVEKLLFDELDLPVVKMSGTRQRSTDQFVLEELSRVHPIPGLILKYRELAKLMNTYIKPLPIYINTKTKRVHTTFSQIDAITGRLASYNPNLQNIPTGSGYGIKVRSAFVAPRGYVFLSADYSQIELRVLAHMTKDKNLNKAFINNHDIHREAAAQIFDVTLDKVTTVQRQVGKRINFSIMYGLTPYGLSKDLGIKPSEAKEYIEQYFANYPGVAKWMEKTVEDAKKKGYVETLFGRRRYFPGLHEKNKNLYEQARRATINTPIQGTSAEIMKLAMLILDEQLIKKKMASKMILQIHDEIVLEVPKDEVEVVSKLVEKTLESVMDWKVPLTVDIRTGKNWEEITK